MCTASAACNIPRGLGTLPLAFGIDTGVSVTVFFRQFGPPQNIPGRLHAGKSDTRSIAIPSS
jgi:hypothetical protein